MQSEAIETAQRAAKNVTAQTHRKPPCFGVDVQAMHDGWEPCVDGPALVFAPDSARPVHQLEIVMQGERDCVRRLKGRTKWAQRWPTLQRCFCPNRGRFAASSMELLDALINGSEIRLLWRLSDARTNRIQVHVHHS